MDAILQNLLPFLIGAVAGAVVLGLVLLVREHLYYRRIFARDAAAKQRGIDERRAVEEKQRKAAVSR